MAKKIITDEYIFKSKVWFQDFVAARFGMRRGERPFITKYDTGWINRSDWTSVHLGSDRTKNADSNVAHNLGAPLSDLLVKVFISTDGTDANSFEVAPGLDDHNSLSTGNICCGINVGQVDANNILIQTGTNGINIVNTDGTQLPIDTEDWYYKIKVWHIG